MRSQIKANGANDVPNAADLIAEISGYDRSSLAEEWHKLFGTTPAKNTSSSILIRIITHEVQCRAYGGLSPASKRALRKEFVVSYRKQTIPALPDIKKTAEKSDSQVTPANQQTAQPPLLSAGTQLIREWNGRPYRVEVTDGGFMLDRKNYRSLSAVAKKITGAHWSGPRFFGLSTSKPKKASGAIAGTVQ